MALVAVATAGVVPAHGGYAIGGPAVSYAVSHAPALAYGGYGGHAGYAGYAAHGYGAGYAGHGLGYAVAPLAHAGYAGYAGHDYYVSNISPCKL